MLFKLYLLFVHTFTNFHQQRPPQYNPSNFQAKLKIKYKYLCSYNSKKEKILHQPLQYHFPSDKIDNNNSSYQIYF